MSRNHTVAIGRMHSYRSMRNQSVAHGGARDHPHRPRDRPPAASGPTTSGRGCSAIGSCSSAPPSTTASANLVVAQLLFLEGEDPERPINLYINSPGGDMTAFFAIHDTMQFLRAPGVDDVRRARRRRRRRCSWRPARPGCATRCPTPGCSSTSPTAGRRASRPTSRSRCGRWWRCATGWWTCSCKATGQTRERITADIDRDHILRGEAAVDYGLVDDVLESRDLRVVPGGGADRPLSATG